MEPTTTGVTALLQAYPPGTQIAYTEYVQVPDETDRRLLRKTDQVLAEHRGILIGYTHDPLEQHNPVTRVAISLYSKREVWLWVDLADIKLVLRPFAALTQQLPDGTVPLCRIAEMTFWTKGFSVESDGASCSMLSRGFRLRLAINPTSWDISVREGQGRMQDAPLRGQAAIFDYLRANHFALPINGKPLIEGQDFIAL